MILNFANLNVSVSFGKILSLPPSLNLFPSCESLPSSVSQMQSLSMEVGSSSSSEVQVSFPSAQTSVLDSLNRQREDGRLCDLSIHVQGQVFKAHRCVLAASSPYFHDQVGAELWRFIFSFPRSSNNQNQCFFNNLNQVLDVV